MDRNELDRNLLSRIVLLDMNKKYANRSNDIIDTSYALKALKTHDSNDFIVAIIEARKIDTPLGKMWTEKLETYYEKAFNKNVDEAIANYNNTSEDVVSEAIDSKDIADIYLALGTINKDNNQKEYNSLNDEFKKQVGFGYEERPEYLLNLENDVLNAKKANNIYYTSIAAENLKKAIELNEVPALTKVYEKWYSEVNELLKNDYEITYDQIQEIKNEARDNYIKNDMNINTNSVMSVIYSLMVKKNETNKDQKVEYRDYEINTEGCTTLDEMYIKYSKEIEEEYKEVYEKKTRLMQDVDSQLDVSDLSEIELKKAQDLRRAKYIFRRDRREYNTEDDYDEETYREIIKKNKELSDILEEKDTIDFNSSKQVFFWVQKLVPYVNIQSVTGNIKEPIDKYILKILSENGYTTEKVGNNDINGFYKNVLAMQLKELEEYGFFVSEYEDQMEENERLTSEKTKEIAKLEYYKELYYEGTRRLKSINNKLGSIEDLRAETIAEYVDQKEKLEKKAKEIDDKINNASDLVVTSQIFKTEDTEAKEAYEIAESNPSVHYFTEMFTKIARLHDRDYKDKMLIAGYSLLDKAVNEEAISKKDFKSIEADNKLTGVKRKNINSLLEEKKDIEDDLKEFAERKEEALNEIDETEDTLVKHRDKYERLVSETKDKLTEVAASLKEKGYVDTSKEFKDIDTGIEENKNGLFDKFKNLFSRNKKNEDEDIILNTEEDSLKSFVPVRTVKKIKKPLYEKVNLDEVKNKISSGIKKVKNTISADVIFAGFFIASLAALTAQAVKTADAKTKTFQEAAEEINALDEVTKESNILEEAVVSDIEIPFETEEEKQEETNEVVVIK